MEKVYKKECYTTLGAFIVVVALTHIFPIYFLFPGLMNIYVFGFPAHYLLTLVVGWLVLMPAFWIYIQISEKIDREITDLSTRAAELEDMQRHGTAPAKGGAE
ncbi:MAG: hypothetical protein EA406_06540 [Rhodospirillales bacterium]|nr:MAG: hypothetical protein EA406_06540 [Rhodospirillales bacterium]